MFDVTIEQDGDTTTVCPTGMLNTLSAPGFSAKLAEIPDSTTKVVLDCAELRYSSSAGLRVLLALQTRMDKCQGTLVVKNLNDFMRETFNDTGFSEIFTIEEEA